MSHDIATINGQHAIVTATDRNGLPWHRLGQTVDSALTWQDAYQKAQLDWTVEKKQLLSPEGNPVPAWGIFRSGETFLGAVGDRYEPIQNKDAFEWVDTVLQAENGAHYESAGALGNGERIWATARIPHDIRIDGTDDVSKSYLLFATSHDGSLSTICKLTSIRVVCNNTLTAALRGVDKSAIRIKHTVSAKQKLEDAKVLIQQAGVNIQNLNEKLNELAKRKVDGTIAKNVFARVFGKDWAESTRKTNKAAQIAELFERNDNNAFPEIRGTAFNLLNGFTEYADHYSSVRKTSGRGETEQVRVENALFGSAEKLKQDALDAILEATEHAPRRSKKEIYQSASIDNILSQVN